jgi:hypothetical protein
MSVADDIAEIAKVATPLVEIGIELIRDAVAARDAEDPIEAERVAAIKAERALAIVRAKKEFEG